MSHTPGPWKVCGGYTPKYIAIHSKNGYIVHEMAESRNTPIENIVAPDTETQRANARLMATAPELLEALKAFVEPWNIGGENWQSKITYDTFNNARIAVEKATRKF